MLGPLRAWGRASVCRVGLGMCAFRLSIKGTMSPQNCLRPSYTVLSGSSALKHADNTKCFQVEQAKGSATAALTKPQPGVPSYRHC